MSELPQGRYEIQIGMRPRTDAERNMQGLYYGAQERSRAKNPIGFAVPEKPQQAAVQEAREAVEEAHKTSA